MTAEEKQRLKEYQRNYREGGRATTQKIFDIFLIYKNAVKSLRMW